MKTKYLYLSIVFTFSISSFFGQNNKILTNWIDGPNGLLEDSTWLNQQLNWLKMATKSDSICQYKLIKIDQKSFTEPPNQLINPKNIVTSKPKTKIKFGNDTLTLHGKKVYTYIGNTSRGYFPKYILLKQVTNTYPKAYVNFDFFDKITKEAKEHRKTRLISFDDFIKKSKEKNTIILDTRSKRMFDRIHIKGAINLTFAELTQQGLYQLIPNKNTRILIYCNNNFKQEKKLMPALMTKSRSSYSYYKKNQLFDGVSQETLALNIPTYINLFGYGYKNIFELDELVTSTNKKLVLVGTDVK